MQRLVTYAVVIALAVGTVGYYRHWFTISSVPNGSGKTSITMEVNNTRFGEDKKAFFDKAGPVIRSLEDKLNALIARSQKADPASKPAIDSQIQTLTQQHNDLKQAVSNLNNTTPEQWQHASNQVNQQMNNLQTGVNQTLSQYEPVP